MRDPARAGQGKFLWNPAAGQIDRQAVGNCDAIVNLAGASIAGRWTAAKKQQIRESRIAATRTIAEAMAALQGRARILVNASAIGYYGSRGEEQLDESSSLARNDYLAEVCQSWESRQRSRGPRRHAGGFARFGVVLSGQGGALKKMLLPFKLGLGGRIGDGRQFMSWIDADDAVGALVHCLTTETVRGPVNVVSANPVTNAQFTKTLCRVLKRPTVFPMPAFVARLAFGEMADSLLLASQRVEPRRLTMSGYTFQYPTLEARCATNWDDRARR